MITDPMNFDPEFRRAYHWYVDNVWWPAVQENREQYDYWRSIKSKRGKAKIIAWEGQDVLAE